MEIGKTYVMRRANSDLVRIESLDSKGGAMVTYIGREHLGRCPVYVDQLLPRIVHPLQAFQCWFDVRIEKFESLLSQQMKELKK